MGLPQLQWACIAFMVIFAFLRGGGPEKIGSIIVAAATVIDRVWQALITEPSMLTLDEFHFVLDASLFVAAYILALRANRIWTMPFASTWLLMVFIHTAKSIDLEMHPLVYAILTQAPFWLSIATVIIGTACYARFKTTDSRGAG